MARDGRGGTTSRRQLGIGTGGARAAGAVESPCVDKTERDVVSGRCKWQLNP